MSIPRALCIAVAASVPWACSDAAETADTRPEPTLPRPPAAVTVAVEGGHLVVRWEDRADDEDGFVIARAEVRSPEEVADASSLMALSTVTADQEFFRDLTTEPGTYYAYGVAARNLAGDSDYALQAGPAQTPLASVSEDRCQVAVPSADDRDGDGLSDAVERSGWRVRVDETGRGDAVDRDVSSDPARADTDGDGVCDALEQLLRTDPTRPDTDADGLDDRAEVEIWGSSPVNVDSDGDASGNTAFFDGAEVERHGTSPSLADSDGDGRSDFEEINQNATNPLVAELPEPELELVGTMDLSLNVELSNGTVEENAISNAFARSEETSVERTNSTATTVTTERSLEVSTSVEASFPGGVNLSVSASFTEGEGLVRDASRAWTASSRRSAREAYEQVASRTVQARETIRDGTLAVQVNIVNGGRRTFELTDLVLTAFTRSPDNPASFTPIATLPMPPAGRTVTLTESETAGPFRLESRIPANVALDLLANPRGLFFRPASFGLSDRTGDSFVFALGETTNNRTALITIDFGGSRAVETYRVATNVRRTAGGRLAGITLAEALATAGLADSDWETTRDERGVSILTRVRNVRTEPRGQGTGKLWAMIAAENATTPTPVGRRLLDPNLDFEARVLLPRDRVYLSYVADEDGDGLFAREERLYGTSDTNPDSDGDGRTDFEEIREGWAVLSNLALYAQQPRVFSSPTEADADADGLDDVGEAAAGTDPNRGDTDGDGVLDGEDAEPLQGLAPPALQVVGTTSVDTPLDFGVDAQQNVYVYGFGGGDIDNDGLLPVNDGDNLSRFLVSYDRAGARRWAVDLEQMPRPSAIAYQPGIHVEPSGRVWWLHVHDDDDLPGTTGTRPHLVEWDADGALRGVHPLSFGADPSFARRFVPAHIEALPSGRFVASWEESFRSVAVVVVDRTGTITAVARGLDVSPDIAVSPAGEILLRHRCEGWVYDEQLRRVETLSFCGEFPSLRAFYIDAAGDFLGLSNDGAVIKRSRAGARLWSAARPGSAQTSVWSSFLDRAGRVFMVLNTPGESVSLRGYLPTGGIAFDLQPGLQTEEVRLLQVDSRGNVFLAGGTRDGVGGRRPVIGNGDISLIRNPQLLFLP